MFDRRSIQAVGSSATPDRIFIFDPKAGRAHIAARKSKGIHRGRRTADRPGFGQEGGRMKMPFGKYQDKELNEIPVSYLRWLRSQSWVGGWLADRIDGILGRSDQGE